MTNFTSLITSKIGESRGVARLWLEGQKLLRAGVMVGARYEVRACRSTRRLELVPCGGKEAERAFTVSRRERNGVVVPLLEFRSPVLRELFSAADRVRVVIRLRPSAYASGRPWTRFSSHAQPRWGLFRWQAV